VLHFKVIFLSIALCLTCSAFAEERIALVVGNGTYTSVSPLENPVSDAMLIARKLEGLGFQVKLLTDSNLVELNKSISHFGRELRAAGKGATGLFYYAGHGVQSFGANYLLPVDTSLTDAADLDLVAVKASSILRQMFSAKNKTNIVILDACRNNPLVDIPEFGDNGLAEMKAPTGTYLSYATSPGKVALDGSYGHSPYTAALAQEMTIPGAPIEQVFKKVRVKVLQQTGGAQIPWDTSSLTNQFYFTQPIVLSEEELAEQRMWDSAKFSRDILQITLFLRSYPDSLYGDEAKSLLTELVNDFASSGKKEKIIDTRPVTSPAAAEINNSEKELIEKAQNSGEIADYEAYLTRYPNGIFAELVQYEIATLREKLAAATETVPAKTEDTASDTPPAAPASVGTRQEQHITFQSLLLTGSPEIDGRSIEELLQGSPLFPPVKGLPESYWLDETCSNCHTWTRDALCDQARVYLGKTAERSLAKQHPYGGFFKKSLRAWASGGCQ
jgi:uncharacterized caspase-like protein